MQDEVTAQLTSWLRPWELMDPRIADELTVTGDRSRAWLVIADDHRYVAKLTFDAPRFTEPGLRIAAALDGAGITTGAPIRTRTGTVCEPVSRSTAIWNVAVLEFVDGDPLDWTAPDAPELCGDLLGRVHRTLSSVSGIDPAGRLLDFYAHEARRLTGRRGEALSDAVAAVHEFDERVGLPFGVLYGDPSPEVLRDKVTGALALIDWGTPSWGPALFDLISWQLLATRQQPANADVVDRLTSAYRQRMPVDDAELAGDDVIHQLYQAIGAISRPPAHS
ncbi:MAG: phosphotransferase enzyme family protein [Nakamurella sp.]